MIVNLPKRVKEGETILCIGDSTAVGQYPMGKGYVYCRSFQSMDPLPEEIDILVLMHEPVGEVRAQLVALVKEGGDIYDAWKENL